MAHLSISLLGPFQVTLDQQPVTGFHSRKVQALLATLAAEPDRPHTREALAGLLWPEDPNPSALTSLRNALANLRLVIGDAQATPPFLIISRDAIQLNPAASLAVDLQAFEDLAGTPEESPNLIQRLEVSYRAGPRPIPGGALLRQLRLRGVGPHLARADQPPAARDCWPGCLPPMRSPATPTARSRRPAACSSWSRGTNRPTAWSCRPGPQRAAQRGPGPV